MSSLVYPGTPNNRPPAANNSNWSANGGGGGGNGNNGSSYNSSSNSSSQQRRGRRTFLQTMALGFVLGVGSSSIFRLMHRVNSEMQTIGMAYDSATHDIPKVTSVVVVNDSSSTKEDEEMTKVVVPITQMTEEEEDKKEKEKKEASKTSTMITVDKIVTEKATEKAESSVSPLSSPLSTSTSTTTTTTTIKEFERQERVVIATKIHGDDKFDQLQQSLCLLHYAYNNRVLYDILIFASEPMSKKHTEELKRIVSPAKLTIVIDNPGIVPMVQQLKPEQQAHLLARCGNKTSIHQLHWKTKCLDSKSWDPISYNWQAEFRTLHIWTQPALAEYKYMLWLDSDGFCTHVWDRDPIAVMMQRNLVLMFDHFPGGRSRGAVFHDKFLKAFGHKVCDVSMTSRKDGGRLYHRAGDCTPQGTSIQQVHGFFHISDLDFYRSERVLHWSRTLIGDSKFSRDFDDQIGITVPAAVYASNQTAEMEALGMNFDVFHNGYLDGKRPVGQGFSWKYWPETARQNFPEAVAGKCNIINHGR